MIRITENITSGVYLFITYISPYIFIDSADLMRVGTFPAVQLVTRRPPIHLLYIVAGESITVYYPGVYSRSGRSVHHSGLHLSSLGLCSKRHKINNLEDSALISTQALYHPRHDAWQDAWVGRALDLRKH